MSKVSIASVSYTHLDVYKRQGLRYWIRGLPEPGASPTLQTDAEGRLTRLEQNGWIIEYPAYAYAAPLSLELPERMIARRQDLSVKLIIEDWSR